jgi:hypothetical protein
MPFPNWIGKKRLWTREAVLAALARAMQEIDGPLPTSDEVWNVIKKGRLDWPGANRIFEYFGTFPRAWLSAGAPEEKVSLSHAKWTREEDDYLKENAGELTLQFIATKLRRSYPSVRGRLRWYGMKARDNQGFFSAAQLSKEFKVPYHRVLQELGRKTIKARRHKERNTWVIDISKLDREAVELLTRPKVTHKSKTDYGDYEHRYGLVRRNIGGKIMRVEQCALAYQAE